MPPQGGGQKAEANAKEIIVSLNDDLRSIMKAPFFQFM